MNLSVPNYRITPEDLSDADKKLQRGIAPLLDALNRSLSAVITSLNGVTLPAGKASSFTTADNGSAYVDLGLGRPPSELWVTAITPVVGTLDSVWSMSWIPTETGARLLFVGLYPSATYSFKARYQ